VTGRARRALVGWSGFVGGSLDARIAPVAAAAVEVPAGLEGLEVAETEIGDVRGKGVEAAAVASLARHTLRAAAIGLVQPSDALATLNKVLLRDETERFCTVVFMRLTWDGAWRAVVSSGGHALPLLSRDGALSVEIGQPGTVLGVVDDPLLYDDETPLQPGDNVLLYTDGIPEGRNGNEFYGEERLAGVVANHHESAGALAEAVVRDVLDFQQQQARDDIAIVAVRVPLPVSSEVG